jgi:hypothetical protein
MSDVILQLKQEGIVRAAGYQVSQWITRYPVGATTPDAMEALFVLRNTLGRESFDRIATPEDLAADSTVLENNCTRFEVRGTNGDFFLGALVGDVIRVSGDSTLHWLQAASPYDDRDFTVTGLIARASGTSVLSSAPTLVTGQLLRLPGYRFTDADVGRWVRLYGFATTAYNGFVQIIGRDGGSAVVDLSVPSGETGGVSSGWEFLVAQIETLPSVTEEPRYFPMAQRDLPWMLLRGGGAVTSGTGGASLRDDETATVFRVARYTAVDPSLDAALGRMAQARFDVEALQALVSANQGSFGAPQTYTYGP